MLQPEQKLALFMEGELTGIAGKMGFGILRYSPNPVACVVDSTHAGKNVQDVIDTPRSAPVVSTVERAQALGAEVLVLGIAPPGGLIPPDWYAVIDDAVERGMSVMNGLHDRLGPRYPNLSAGQWIWDIRVEPEGLLPARGEAASLGNKRVLMIGTDMAVGKMTAGLELLRSAQRSTISAAFVATGQIGISITGSGVPLDAVRVDYACGAIEREVMRAAEADIIIVEGQGALGHPASTSTLPLLRGSMATHLILCHRARQTTLRRHEHIPIPPLNEYCRLYEDLGEACGTFPRPKTVAIALNTAFLTDDEAAKETAAIEKQTGFPCADPVRHGADKLLQAVQG